MKFLFHLVKVNKEDRELNFQPQINTEEVFKEHDIFKMGLPKLQDLTQKKRKSEEEKLCIESIKNPPPSPFDNDLCEHRPMTESEFNMSPTQNGSIGTQQSAF